MQAGETEPRMKSRGMKLIQRLLLAVLGPVLVLGGAEGVLRLGGYGVATDYFMAADIGGRKVWVENPFFGCRFFPERIARTPPCAVFDRRKAPGTIRVFVLGESAAMGEPLEEFGVARQMGCLLEARYPGKRFEVVNAAMTAINSHGIVEIAREVAGREADAIILYMGNNEVVGPYGPGTVFGRFAGWRGLTRARVWATRWRLAQVLRLALGGWRAGAADAWEGLEMFAQRQVGEEDERLGAVRRQFRANVEEIIGLARRAGAEVILCTVAVNLRDCAPFGGEAAWARYAEAQAREEAGRIREADEGYGRARDGDTLRVRADGAINGILREMGEAGSPGVRLVDVERRIRGPGGRVPGHETFLDHVHFNFAGNYAVARELAAAVAELPALRGVAGEGWLTLEECRERLMYTVWSELDLTDQFLQRLQRPPFREQPGNERRVRALMRHGEELKESVESAGLKELRTHFLRAIEEHPGDGWYRAGWGAVLCERGEYGEAEGHLQAALALAPHHYDQRAALALLLGSTGRAGEGVGTILGRKRKGGGLAAQYLASVGRVLMRSGQVGAAEEFLREAVRWDGGHLRARQDLAACFVKQGRLGEAEAELREVLTRRPGQVEAEEDLAVLLAVSGKMDEAGRRMERILRTHPARAEAQVKHALLLLQGGDRERAVKALKKALELQPGNADARALLEQVQGAGGGGQSEWGPRRER